MTALDLAAAPSPTLRDKVADRPDEGNHRPESPPEPAATDRRPPSGRTAPARVGWCPGALRPMAAGDGMLVRIKPRGHRLSVAQSMAIADLAERHGNGALTLTARANLQLRGIGEAHLPALTAALAALGLLDPSAEGEAVRNVVSSPLAGTGDGLCDLRPAVTALEDRLATDPRMWRLPAKFAFVVDEGGWLGLGSVAADIRVTAVARNGVAMLAVALPGGGVGGLCRMDELAEVAARLAEAFLMLCARAAIVPHRMADLVAACGTVAILSEAGLAPATLPPVTPPRHAVGILAGAPGALGAAPAFGLLDAGTFRAFAAGAARAGAADIRLTPWRSLLVAGLNAARAETLAAALAPTALILDPADPRLHVAACVGAPACHRATTPVPADAARLLPLLSPGGASGIGLHVSGCGKGCAHAGDAAITLVGDAGRYALVRGGRAGGQALAAGLSVEALLAMLPAQEGP